MDITIRVIGKEKDPNISALTKEYLKRMPWSVAIKEFQNQETKLQEAKLLLEGSQGGFHIALDETGELVDSVEFSKLIKQKTTFYIGGAFGLHEDVRNKCSKVISFGRMTLPHKLIRLVLVEQIYRAYTLSIGHPYHKY